MIANGAFFEATVDSVTNTAQRVRVSICVTPIGRRYRGLRPGPH